MKMNLPAAFFEGETTYPIQVQLEPRRRHGYTVEEARGLVQQLLLALEEAQRDLETTEQEGGA